MHVMMLTKEMERRRRSALRFLQESINELGPITDETGMVIRDPVLDLIDGIYKIGKELKALEFDVYGRRVRGAAGSRRG